MKFVDAIAKFIEKKLPENLAGKKKVHTFATLLGARRAFSSAGSEHLPYKQRVGGSNPSTPTTHLLKASGFGPGESRQSLEIFKYDDF